MELTVMIVDDDPIASYLLEKLIKRKALSNEPLAFEGVRETLDYFERNDAPDKLYLVFLDINMPPVSGWQLMDFVRQKAFSARVYFLMITSSVDSADRQRAQNYPQVVGFLEKPIDGKMVEAVKGMEILRGVDFGSHQEIP